MVKALHRAGIEVILDVVYNHTAKGDHLGPMLELQGRRQPELLPARARRPALLHGLHRDRRHAQPGASDGAAADHGLAAVLRPRLPRRRVPVRSGVGARTRVLRGRPALRRSSTSSTGPSPLPGEADRRAVGRRSGRLQVGNFPILWSEWNGIYRDTDARLLARCGAAARLRVAVRRVGRPVPERRPKAVRVGQLRHRARRLHAARPRLVQREARRRKR